MDGQPPRFGNHRSTTTSNSPVVRGRTAATGRSASSREFYETAVYYCYNKLAGIFCFTSFDGGASFEAGGQIIGLATTNGGLHGRFPPPPTGRSTSRRVATPTVIVSKDNGSRGLSATWARTRNPNPRKNSEVPPTAPPTPITCGRAPTKASTCPVHGFGETWEQESIRISPVEVISSVFLKPMPATPGALPSPTWAVKTRRC